MDSLLNSSSDELKRDGIMDNSIIQNSQKKNEHEQELILMDEIKITSRPDKKQILVEQMNFLSPQPKQKSCEVIESHRLTDSEYHENSDNQFLKRVAGSQYVESNFSLPQDLITDKSQNRFDSEKMLRKKIMAEKIDPLENYQASLISSEEMEEEDYEDEDDEEQQEKHADNKQQN